MGKLSRSSRQCLLKTVTLPQGTETVDNELFELLGIEYKSIKMETRSEYFIKGTSAPKFENKKESKKAEYLFVKKADYLQPKSVKM